MRRTAARCLDSQGILALAGGLALVVGLVGCGGGGGGGGVVARTADVRGRVVHDGTLTGLSGVTVEINGANVATTDGVGDFTAYDVPAGDVHFRVSKPGYDTVSEDRDLSPNAMNDLRSAPFFLPPTLLAGHGCVSGRIVDASSSAASGAGVVVTTSSSANGVTRNDGTFCVYNIPAGIGNLTATGTASQPGNAYLFGIAIPSGSELGVGTLTLSNAPPPPPFP